MTKPVQNSGNKTSSNIKFETGAQVVFLTDVAHKSGKGRITYSAKVGSTGTVKKVNEDGTFVVDLTKRLSSKHSQLTDVLPDWIAPLVEPVTIVAPVEDKPEGPLWRGFEYSALKVIAEEHGLSWRETANEKINIMWVIAALNKAGIKPPEK